MSKSGNTKSAWVTSWAKHEKPWGHEMVWSSFISCHGKLLFLKKGHRTSLKFNNRKSESLLILSGNIRAFFGNEMNKKNPDSLKLNEEILGAGMILNVQSECPYRLEAIEDSQIIELGDWLDEKPHRLEDDYGRESIKAS